MPIVYLLGLRHDISSAIANGAFGITALIVLMIVFAEKFFSLPRCLKSQSSAKVLDETQPSSCQTAQIFSQDVVRSMKPDEQFEYYTKIILKYSALRLQLNAADSSFVSQSESELPNQGTAAKYLPAADCDVELP
jgi:hypothetical protein